MTRIFTLVFIVFLAFNLNAQEVLEEQRTLLTKKTATWCPYCGGWGWSFMKDIMSDNRDKAVIIGAHYSGDLRTDDAADLVSMFGGGGQPVFYCDERNMRVSRSNTSTKRTEIRDIVNSNFNEMPVVNAGLEIEDNGVDLEIDVKVEFFQPTSGDYNVAVWVIEDDVVNYQSGQGPNAEHPYVFRTSVNGVTGEQIASGS
ncbi:MAG: Omp28-related outer membrane protein, partial [Saprospiraceae bacterium]|nr:Omp28-related outer membrane protein [Saprospiraceae bacterium]